jgi:ribosomal protein L9
MMASKIAAFLDRKEIRDVYDMEFLLKRGVAPDAKDEDLKQILKNIDSFTKRDYTVKLSSLLEETQRKYYVTENFKLLKAAIRQRFVRVTN